MDNIVNKITDFFSTANIVATAVLIALVVLVIRFFKIKVW